MDSEGRQEEQMDGMAHCSANREAILHKGEGGTRCLICKRRILISLLPFNDAQRCVMRVNCRLVGQLATRSIKYMFDELEAWFTFVLAGSIDVSFKNHRTCT